MFERFVSALAPSRDDQMLDVGVTSDRLHDHSNYFEAWYPHKDRIVAAGLEDASFLEEAYPGVRFVQADARDLPFDDGSYDYVHSSAVIEHVGSQQQQVAFLKELWRVARRGIFVTTPNRWFPIEVHTVLPLIHWLPPSTFRGILRGLGRDFFADEANLNLMSASSFGAAARAAGIGSFRIETVSLVGWPSNLLLIARKGS
ncbi:class I SAM-dependent methyltransferase [Reyranella sp.]|uniref:class I SAM-dependent methyltransferase n=1 Tax=Reyranella sp. TaxID=1929291 RepID=UPI003BA983F4